MGLAPGHLGVGRTWHFSLPSVALPSLPPAAFRAPALPSAWVPGLMVPAGMIARRGLEGEPPALPPGSACSLDSAGQEAKTSPASAWARDRTGPRPPGDQDHRAGGWPREGRARPSAAQWPTQASWAEGGHQGGRVRPSLDPLKPGAGTGFFSCRPLQGQHRPAVPLDFPPPQGAQFTLSFITSTEL